MPAIRPGGSLQRTTVSVGPALRKVREARGVTLEEAARDTRVRLEFLFWDFTWPLWLLTMASALLGALVWLGLGVMRRHRRRKERRQARRD
jgi:cytochrome c-type biogenesis protein CcmH/NrfF